MDKINRDELPRRSSLHEFVRARLSPESFVGLHLTVGLVALGAALLLFGVIAENVAAGDSLTRVDARINAWLHAHNQTQLTTFCLLISNLHSNLVVTTVTVAICAYLWERHLRYWVLTFVFTVFGGMLLNYLLKLLFVRPRPHFDDPILILTTFSFPSGHTLLAVVFYGTLCVFAVSRLRVWKLRVPLIFTGLLMIALVGFSRMYLGVHYLSDVLGAIVEGLAWLALCLITVGILRMRRGIKREHTRIRLGNESATQRPR
ncbi:MAG TPA: phosphatase PAP2 family protein [Pyrinomonadaceae bacterium]|nr:phosphatase PAP2 family protein [Pyrinomonadaceae bacterium]